MWCGGGGGGGVCGQRQITRGLRVDWAGRHGFLPRFNVVLLLGTTLARSQLPDANTVLRTWKEPGGIAHARRQAQIAVEGATGPHSRYLTQQKQPCGTGATTCVAVTLPPIDVSVAAADQEELEKSATLSIWEVGLQSPTRRVQAGTDQATRLVVTTAAAGIINSTPGLSGLCTVQTAVVVVRVRYGRTGVGAENNQMRAGKQQWTGDLLPHAMYPYYSVRCGGGGG